MTWDDAELRDFLTQQITWKPSDFDDNLEVAFIEVPLDYADPSGERIELAISRIPAADPRRRRGVLLFLNGGPGGDGGLGRLLPTRLAGTPPHEVYDLIGFDPRGTGESARIEGEASPTTTPFDSRPPDSAFAAITADMKERDQGCVRAGGTLRRHITTANNARDMNVIRVLLGEERISYVGWAYGTLLGAVYGAMFGAHLDRSVLDSSVHPDWDWRTQFASQALAVRENVDLWAQWAAERDGFFGLGDSAGRVLASVESVAESLAPLGENAALRTSFDGLVGTMGAARGKWRELGTLIGELREAAGAGDIERVRGLLAGQTRWRPGTAAGGLRDAVLEAVTCETPWPTDLEIYYRDMREFRGSRPYGFGVMRAQPWVAAFRTCVPTEPRPAVTRGDYPKGLVVQADGDPFDHLPGALAMAERLGHPLILVRDSGAHEIYRLGGNAQVDALVDAYLVDGELPPARVECAGEPRPDVPADANGAARHGS
ncbi:alpha/beta fold hydrolase [Streptomyces sp. NPDC048297]|uniref:alpha/beta fold hydrolase n=1 Tax=Streptomyces sp. NPDC048297 TaxID=3365531 RepID=UPI00372180BE